MSFMLLIPMGHVMARVAYLFSADYRADVCESSSMPGTAPKSKMPAVFLTRWSIAKTTYEPLAWKTRSSLFLVTRVFPGSAETDRVSTISGEASRNRIGIY